MTSGETDLKKILQSLSPTLNPGDFVYCVVEDISVFSKDELIGSFRESEGITAIVSKETADRLKISYQYVAAWITLEVHSSLSSVGLTAAFSQALGKENISCNVIAGFYHDHLFVAKEEAQRTVQVLRLLADQV